MYDNDLLNACSTPDTYLDMWAYQPFSGMSTVGQLDSNKHLKSHMYWSHMDTRTLRLMCSLFSFRSWFSSLSFFSGSRCWLQPHTGPWQESLSSICSQVPWLNTGSRSQGYVQLAWAWVMWITCLLAAAATAKSLQSCPTLCDPIDGSPPGSPVPGILQARTLEWVAISFSNAWKWKVKVKSLSRVRL